MKKILVIGLIITTLSLVAGSAITVFADGPADGETTLTDNEAWKTMYEGCQSGDWEKMAEGAEKFHGANGGGNMMGSDSGAWMGGGMMGGSMMNW
ncbi:MAG: hypothetical protein KKF26_07245 [Chloroflexi bacterium]|nr:hypothetical protein [Chloroflexota bacterium]